MKIHLKQHTSTDVSKVKTATSWGGEEGNNKTNLYALVWLVRVETLCSKTNSRDQGR